LEGLIHGKTFNQDFLSFSNLTSYKEKNLFWSQKLFTRLT